MNMPNIPAAIETFIDATNAGDADRFVGSFTSAAVLDDWGRIYVGRAGLYDWDRTDNTGVGAHLELLSLDTSDDPATFVGTVRVRSGRFNGIGTMRFQLRDDLIADLRIT